METVDDACHLCGNKRALVVVISRNMGTNVQVTDGNECRPDCSIMITRRVLDEARDKVEDKQSLGNSDHI